MSVQKSPKRLKKRCERAARRAETLARREARRAVSVVPTLSPMTRAAAMGNCNQSLQRSAMAMSMVAADERKMKVKQMPNSTKRRTLQKP